MPVVQRWDEDRNAYVDETSRYWVRPGNRVVIDLKTGLVIPPDELGRYISPALKPQSGTEFTQGGFGKGLDFQKSTNTGDAQPDHSLLSGPSKGLVSLTRVGDELSPFPDHSGIVNSLLAVFSPEDGV